MGRSKDSLSHMSGTPWHVEKMTRAEGDARRHPSRCIYYSRRSRKEESKCSKLFGRCNGAAHCPYYEEGDEDRAGWYSQKITYDLPEVEKKEKKPFKGVLRVNMSDLALPETYVKPSLQEINDAISRYARRGESTEFVPVECCGDCYLVKGNYAFYFAAKRIQAKHILIRMHNNNKQGSTAKVKEGTKVYHRTCGVGQVKEFYDGKAVIKFANGDVRTFQWENCLKR